MRPQGPLYFHKLIGKSGRKGNMVDWREMLNAECPKRDAPGYITAATCVPDLPKVL